MALDPETEKFKSWLVGEYRGDATFDGVTVLERPEAGEADLVVRLNVANKSYYDVRLVEELQELQIGFATENRMVNEGIEQMILDNGGDLDDLLADELSDLGEDPLHMDHFFDRPAFRFAVRVTLPHSDELGEASTRKRVKNVIQASRILFQGCVDEA